MTLKILHRSDKIPKSSIKAENLLELVLIADSVLHHDGADVSWGVAEALASLESLRQHTTVVMLGLKLVYPICGFVSVRD